VGTGKRDERMRLRRWVWGLLLMWREDGARRCKGGGRLVCTSILEIGVCLALICPYFCISDAFQKFIFTFGTLFPCSRGSVAEMRET
jgi:hypothetical protein